MVCAVLGLLLSFLLFPNGTLGLPQGDSQVPLHAGEIAEALSVSKYEKHGFQFERVQHSLYDAYQLRISQPKLCDKEAQQYSGYLDIADDKHLFFWFFEARHDPQNAPLMLWLNGGPGASTIASGLLFENGPCKLNPATGRVEDNPYGWNEKVNIIYLDQPVGTGYSYGTGDSTTLANLAADVYAFLQLFLQRFPRYARAPLHIAGESWGGHYVPHIGAYVDAQNDRLVYAPRRGQLHVNLASLLLGNGLTEPASQLETPVDYLCGAARYPPFKRDDSRCAMWRAAIPPCLRMIKTCYEYQNNATCGPATAYCWPAVFNAPLDAAREDGHNVYDLRKPCDESPGGLCYSEFNAIELWLNKTSTKLELGVDPDYTFRTTNPDVQFPFYHKGQALLNSAALLVPLINHGIRLLAYAGDVDGVCNYMGIELWMKRLEHKYHGEFEYGPWSMWVLPSGYWAGAARSAGNGSVTYVRVFEAGHMAPFDQPEATLDMISRWVDGKPF
ncbi:peptidase S10 serine carboxypeptidase [Phanerochaete sordida]|uniref:Peptidase S10 serine carboxypeptidase n=1 Tax=Phanerochaete sordida TaxID=48140 RepID=A0A9P3L899_9APHY|nr:peptidase S10 serine carboxypeptidase [Phanerochaete sordida]